MARSSGIPVMGEDATGAAGYVKIVDAPTAPHVYTHLVMGCGSNDAIVSLDGGVSESIVVEAGVGPLKFDDVWVKGEIQAKNRAVGAYTDLYVFAW